MVRTAATSLPRQHQVDNPAVAMVRDRSKSVKECRRFGSSRPKLRVKERFNHSLVQLRQVSFIGGVSQEAARAAVEGIEQVVHRDAVCCDCHRRRQPGKSLQAHAGLVFDLKGEKWS